MGAAAEVRAVLIDAALSKMFCDEEDSLREWRDGHNPNASPYADCADYVCTLARRQADDVIAALHSAGFSIRKGT